MSKYERPSLEKITEDEAFSAVRETLKQIQAFFREGDTTLDNINFDNVSDRVLQFWFRLQALVAGVRNLSIETPEDLEEVEDLFDSLVEDLKVAYKASLDNRDEAEYIGWLNNRITGFESFSLYTDPFDLEKLREVQEDFVQNNTFVLDD